MSFIGPPEAFNGRKIVLGHLADRPQGIGVDEQADDANGEGKGRGSRETEEKFMAKTGRMNLQPVQPSELRKTT